MATKNNPGKYDCYGEADPNMPLFTLVGKDPIGSHLVAMWAAIRADDVAGAEKIMANAFKELHDSGKPILPYDSEKSIEAQQCAKHMAVWYLGLRIDKIEKRLSEQK